MLHEQDISKKVVLMSLWWYFYKVSNKIFWLFQIGKTYVSIHTSCQMEKLSQWPEML